MKKTSIRLLSMLFAVMLAVMCCGTALADSVTFTTPNPTADNNVDLKTHTMVAYQIFKCTIVNNKLIGVKWGDGITSSTFLSKLVELHAGDATIPFNTSMTAAQCAAAIAKNASNAECAKHIQQAAEAAKKDSGKITLDASGSTTLERGYYMIVDETATIAEGDARNKTVLTYTNDATFGLKTDKPTVEKKVKENKDFTANDGYGAGYNDVADWNIGDNVPFLLIGAIPNMDHYETYKYMFTDTLSSGLTLNASSITVYFSDDKQVDDGDKVIASTNYTKANTANGFTLSFDNLKAEALGAKDYKYVLVAYTAKLNQNAEIGLPGNPNEVYLTYSNNPDHSGTGDNETGNTPKDKVIVFTYGAEGTKTDNGTTPQALGGAEFYLYRNNNGTIQYANLTPKTGTTVATWIFNGWKDNEADKTTITSDANGKFAIIGLDDGTYHLYESKAPAGYIANTNPTNVTITATTVNGQNWDGINPSEVLTGIVNGKAVAGNTDTGMINGTVTNTPVGLLPETGGMGTTMFTISGLVMMMAAAMLFALRRREEQ